MKIFINSVDRWDSISVHTLLDGYDWYVVVHDQEQYDLYKEVIPEDRLINSETRRSIIDIRNYIIEELVEEGEWYIRLDDNITHLTMVDDAHYGFSTLDVQGEPEKFKDVYNTPTDFSKVYEKIVGMTKMAERTGANLIGFCSNENFFFRSKKYRDVGYIIGKAVVHRKTDLLIDKNLVSTDDYGYTAQQLYEYGKVLINNYICFHKKHYSPGGIGGRGKKSEIYERRKANKIKDVEYLMEEFPALFRYSSKKTGDAKAEIQIRFTNINQVKKWRAALRYEKTRPKTQGD